MFKQRLDQNGKKVPEQAVKEGMLLECGQIKFPIS